MFQALFSTNTQMGIFPVAGLFIFFAIFLFVVIRVGFMEMRLVRYLSKLPLEEPSLRDHNLTGK